MRKLFLSISILITVLPLEIYFSEQAYFTIGAYSNALFQLASYLSILLSILFLILNKTKFCIGTLVLGLFTIVPVNMYYAKRWQNLKIESDEIVHWVYQQKLNNNSFPEKLIRKHDPRIKYTKENEYGFTLFFYVTTPNTGHFYTPKDGWCYMDD
jgi:uncharacterized membrane protein